MYSGMGLRCGACEDCLCTPYPSSRSVKCQTVSYFQSGRSRNAEGGTTYFGAIVGHRCSLLTMFLTYELGTSCTIYTNMREINSVAYGVLMLHDYFVCSPVSPLLADVSTKQSRDVRAGVYAQKWPVSPAKADVTPKARKHSWRRTTPLACWIQTVVIYTGLLFVCAPLPSRWWYWWYMEI